MLPTICPDSLIPIAEEDSVDGRSGVRFVTVPFCQRTARPGDSVANVEWPTIWPASLRAFAIPAWPPSVGERGLRAVLPEESAGRRSTDHLASAPVSGAFGGGRERRSTVLGMTFSSLVRAGVDHQQHGCVARCPHRQRDRRDDQLSRRDAGPDPRFLRVRSKLRRRVLSPVSLTRGHPGVPGAHTRFNGRGRLRGGRGGPTRRHARPQFRHVLGA
jgi:hypothetical protein